MPAHVVAFVVPVGEFHASVQQTGERGDVREIIALA